MYDLDRFVGSWFEIARLPDGTDAECVSDARVTYARTEDGLRLLSLCRRENGSDQALDRPCEAGGRRHASCGSRFRIPIQRSMRLPFVWSDYTIIDVADDYSTAIVGAADRKHLWCLSRQPSVGDAVAIRTS